MTRRYTGAEARELLEAARVQYIEPGRTVLLPGTNAANARLLLAAPDLAESLAALEAERDALRAAVREYLAAHADERHADAAAFAAFWQTNNMLAPDYPEKCAAHSAARALWKTADEKRIAALAALREAAK